MLSYRTWQRHGSDPNMIGTQVAINGTFFRVIGVAPRGFTGTSIIGPDVWLPLGSFGRVGHLGRERAAGPGGPLGLSPLSLVGRLKPGVNMASALCSFSRSSRAQGELPAPMEGEIAVPPV